jgi:hypothetical protein
MIEVRGSSVRLDLRCTSCGQYIGDRLYAEAQRNALAWPRLADLIRQAQQHQHAGSAL